MTLIDRITADMKSAMKNKNSATLSTLRLLRSALKNKQIELQKELEDGDVLVVVKTQVKQLVDSVESFVQGAREDLADKARAEIAVLEAYMPEQMSDEELERIVKEAVHEIGVTTKQEMGKVMGAVMKKVSDAADGTRVKRVVEKLLGVFAFVVAGTLVGEPVHAAITIMASESSVSDFEMGLRIGRVLLLWIGVFAVNSILHGGFHYMGASSRDNEHLIAWKKMTTGFFGSIVVVTLFVIATVYIELL